MSDYKEFHGNSYLGKIPVTLLLDEVETASTLVKLARQYQIPVLEENVILSQLITKSGSKVDAISRVQEIAEQMNKSKEKPPKEQSSIVDKLIQTIKK
ncbi:MAG: hypothetical protein E6559_03230 [Pantoea sp.]|uniref:hypothetical protein n=1 Tax=Pantoea piersonii TaxID=2364647 RepID=UPI0028AB58AE|nr:hypothetical protein [Pantoea piersonii]MDU6438921.1 hypothetical protein [Pantoea sp.]